MNPREFEFGKNIDVQEAFIAAKKAKEIGDELLESRQTLSPDMAAEELGRILDRYDDLLREATVAQTISSALREVSNNDEEAVNNEARISKNIQELAEEHVFFALTLQKWGPEALDAFAKALPRHEGQLRRLKNGAKHALSEAEEKLALFKGTVGSEQLLSVYGQLESNFEYEMEVEGEKKTLALDEVRQLARHKDRAIRKEATEIKLGPYQELRGPLTAIYRGLSQDWDGSATKFRRYDAPIDVRHMMNELDSAVYPVLCDAVKDMLPLMKRYFALKIQLLGYETFERWDMYAPLDNLPDGMTFEEVVNRCLEVFKDFSPWLHDMTKRMVDEKRIDVLPRKGKRGGACCIPNTVHKMPLVLLNHAGNYQDLYTFAHEMGHAVHSQLAWDVSPASQDAQLVICETASTFCELLVAEAEMKRLDNEGKKALLINMLDDAQATILRQVMFVEWEIQAHKHIDEGKNPKELDALWAKMNEEFYPGMKQPVEPGWMAIPHFFHWPFYCYAYAFGQLLVFALWKKREEHPEGFADKLKAILEAGGTKTPKDLLSEHGFDISDIEFWRGGVHVVEEWLEELESLVE